MCGLCSNVLRCLMFNHAKLRGGGAFIHSCFGAVISTASLGAQAFLDKVMESAEYIPLALQKFDVALSQFYQLDFGSSSKLHFQISLSSMLVSKQQTIFVSFNFRTFETDFIKYLKLVNFL